MNGDNNPLTGEYKTYSVTGADGATSYNWYFDVGNGVKGTNVGGWQILSYGYQDKSIYAKVGNPGSTVVVCEATNSCGERMKYLFVNVRGELEPCGGLRLSANPMKSGDPGNHVIYPPIDPCDDPYGRETEDSKKTIEIFDQYGVRVLIKSQVGNEFDLSHLKSGFYIIKSKSKSKSISGKTMTEKLIVE